MCRSRAGEPSRIARTHLRGACARKCRPGVPRTSARWRTLLALTSPRLHAGHAEVEHHQRSDDEPAGRPRPPRRGCWRRGPGTARRWRRTRRTRTLPTGGCRTRARRRATTIVAASITGKSIWSDLVVTGTPSGASRPVAPSPTTTYDGLHEQGGARSLRPPRRSGRRSSARSGPVDQGHGLSGDRDLLVGGHDEHGHRCALG